MRLQKDAKSELLKSVPLFEGCSKTEMQKIASLADELDLGEGATLIREGERGREFIVIADGTVRVTRNGKEVSVLGAGDFIGEIALIAYVPRTSTVTSTSPVRLLFFTDRSFRSLLEQIPSIAKKFLQLKIKRVPVVDDEHKVLGVVSRKDILKALAGLLPTSTAAEAGA